MPDLVTTTLADHPEIEGAMWQMPDSWPEFMGHDEIAAALFLHVPSTFPHLCVVATEFALDIERHGRWCSARSSMTTRCTSSRTCGSGTGSETGPTQRSDRQRADGRSR